MKRKPIKQAARLHAPKERTPATPDPTPEEIWGVGGLAEQERMKRPDSHWPEWKQPKDGGK